MMTTIYYLLAFLIYSIALLSKLAQAAKLLTHIPKVSTLNLVWDMENSV
jgi:hypothetical protein